MGSGAERATAHVERFNDAVRCGNWDTYLDGLAESVQMEFVGVKVGPYDGKSAVSAAYRSNPPDDTISITDMSTEGSIDIVRFSWSRGGSGTLRLTWTSEDLVDHQTIEFN